MAGHIASEDLRLGIERILRLEEEKKGIADDIKDVYAEYKSKGYDTKTMREIVKLSKMTPDDRREREALLDTYKAALGMAGRPQAYRIVLDLRGQGMVAIPRRGAVRSIEVTAAGAAHVAGPIIINGARYRFVPAPGGDFQ